MPTIHVLPPHVADLIAAGEVVERPASVVKELCENALDAEATAITVEISGGGVRYLRVTDNGGGMAREDVRNAFLPHATSKIRNEDDLDHIMTLGFRGEALASIAAVAKVQLLTRRAEDETGVCYIIEAGEEVQLEDAGCPAGTTIIMRELFFHTPARMKFLKKDVTEGAFVGAALERLALSRPDVSFTFQREGKQVFHTPGDGNPGSVVRAVLGKQFYEGMLGVKNTQGGIEVTGFTCVPAAARPTRGQQYFFLNGRYIKCPVASAALGEAYKRSVLSGKFPSCVLYLAIPPGLVDVNVHPAKTEVRFADDRPVFLAVYQSAAGALSAECATHSAQLSEMPPATSPTPMPAFAQAAIQPHIVPTPPLQYAACSVQHLNDPNADENPLPQEEKAPVLIRQPELKSVAAPEQTPAQQTQIDNELRIANCIELFRTYFLCERGDELLLIDKHAAHERIIYERLKTQQGAVQRQVLLEPLPLRLSREEAAVLLEHSGVLEQAGFLVEEFGVDTLVLRECPMLLAGHDLQAQAAEIAGYLLQKRGDVTTEALDWIFHSAACRAAVKAGDPITPYERERFSAQLLAMPNIRHCPHGRPVMITLTKRELEKRFGR
jgi:DNA mismatch repair protein MutL